MQPSSTENSAERRQKHVDCSCKSLSKVSVFSSSLDRQHQGLLTLVTYSSGITCISFLHLDRPTFQDVLISLRGALHPPSPRPWHEEAWPTLQLRSVWVRSGPWRAPLILRRWYVKSAQLSLSLTSKGYAYIGDASQSNSSDAAPVDCMFCEISSVDIALKMSSHS
jgi:hypothetical protein